MPLPHGWQMMLRRIAPKQIEQLWDHFRRQGNDVGEGGFRSALCDLQQFIWLVCVTENGMREDFWSTGVFSGQSITMLCAWGTDSNLWRNKVGERVKRFFGSAFEISLKLFCVFVFGAKSF